MPAVHYTNRYMLKPEFTGNAFLIEDPDLMGPIFLNVIDNNRHVTQVISLQCI